MVKSYHAMRKVARDALALLKKTVKISNDDSKVETDMKIVTLKETLPLVFPNPRRIWGNNNWKQTQSRLLKEDVIMRESSDEGEKMELDV